MHSVFSFNCATQCFCTALLGAMADINHNATYWFSCDDWDDDDFDDEELLDDDFEEDEDDSDGVLDRDDEDCSAFSGN